MTLLSCPDLTTTRKALTSAITTATAIPGYWYLPGSPESDCFAVKPTPQETLSFSVGAVRYLLEVIVIAGASDNEAAQEFLDAAVSPHGPQSIFAAIRAAETLGTSPNGPGDATASLHASATQGVSSYAVMPIGLPEVLKWAAVIPVTVIATAVGGS